MIRRLGRINMAAILVVGLTLLSIEREPASAQTAPSPQGIVTLEGVVASVAMGVGQEFPTFVLTAAGGSSVTIITGAYSYLLDNDFEVRVGDRIVSVAFPSLWHDGAYVAIDLKNLSTGKAITLRDENGRPLWITAGPGGPGDGLGWLPPDGVVADPVTLEGTVANVSLACGQEFPAVALAMSDGKLVTVVTGPYYFLLENGFELGAGDRLTTRAYLSRWYADTYVALELTNLTTGKTLLLRDGLGAPVWTGGEQLVERGFGYGGSAAWFCVEAGRTQVFKGKVRSINPGIGAAYPSLSMMNAQGEMITIMLSPNHFMLQNGFAVGVGDRVKVWAFAAEGFDRLFVERKMTNITRGQGISLREANGQPHWRRP